MFSLTKHQFQFAKAEEIRNSGNGIMTKEQRRWKQYGLYGILQRTEKRNAHRIETTGVS